MKAFRALTTALVLTAACGSSQALTDAELRKMTAAIINMNGLLCARVVDIRPLPVGKYIFEVTCIEYRGGTGRKVYLMDAARGIAWVP